MVWKFLDDFKVPNINMVHGITMQVDIIMKEVKKEEFARLKWIKFNDRCCVDLLKGLLMILLTTYRCF